RSENVDLDEIRQSYVKHAVEETGVCEPKEEDILFMAEDSRSSIEFINNVLNSFNIEVVP
ncbi:MAG: hypothetical protein KAT75_00185, partial [Dehalococcoidia bacterium]|nr:hypothetical protein [Dehalococcoidia bacterium]